MNEITRLAETQNSNNLIIGEGVSFTGSIVVPNLAIINGKFEGEITSRKLIVETDGQVSGTSNASDIEVKGILKSTVRCSSLLTIHSTGRQQMFLPPATWLLLQWPCGHWFCTSFYLMI
jgi:cytoskeletal protein CcmA (bactofilin family)